MLDPQSISSFINKLTDKKSIKTNQSKSMFEDDTNNIFVNYDDQPLANNDISNDIISDNTLPNDVVRVNKKHDIKADNINVQHKNVLNDEYGGDYDNNIKYINEIMQKIELQKQTEQNEQNEFSKDILFAQNNIDGLRNVLKKARRKSKSKASKKSKKSKASKSKNSKNSKNSRSKKNRKNTRRSAKNKL
jgi:hypothetical protein